MTPLRPARENLAAWPPGSDIPCYQELRGSQKLPSGCAVEALAPGMAFAHSVRCMAPTVKWTIAPDFVKVAAFGEASRDDIVAAIVGATRNPRFVRGMGLLVDGRALRAQGGSTLSHDELRERTNGIAALGFGRCALIAEGNGARLPLDPSALNASVPTPTYGLPTAVFSDPGSAERWVSSRSRN